jgi:hypothetical protein
MLAIRPWCLKDAGFVVKMRNKPELQKWFRQERDLTLDEQILFMTHSPNYKGYILLEDNRPVGVFALNKDELCIVAPLDYHMFGIRALEKVERPERMWGEVFFGNPALSIYLNDCGFKTKEFRVNRYMKNGQGIDVVVIEKLCAS